MQLAKRTIFQNFDDLDTHKLRCDYFKNTAGRNPKRDKSSFNGISASTIIENVGRKPEIKLKLVNSWAVFLESEESLRTPDEKLATNMWGRKLPRRTKVPYLSRAVPLSNDHSYERCPCGAVFVTRLGKRQHQARFCKFVKNKVKPAIEETESSEPGHVFQVAEIRKGSKKCRCIIIIAGNNTYNN